jgi:broad specificity phosphatase PhoE
MRVYIIRHGTASHLLEDYQRKVNYEEFMEILEEWKKSTLTPLGEQEIQKQVNALKNMYTYIFYSPLRRTKQTARAFLTHPDNMTLSKALPQLTEIYISPPRMPRKLKIKIRYWVYLCVVKSLYTLSIFRYYFQARQIIHRVKKVKDDILIISHQARIFTLIVYAALSPGWKVIKTDFNPAGVCIIEKKLRK